MLVTRSILISSLPGTIDINIMVFDVVVTLCVYVPDLVYIVALYALYQTPLSPCARLTPKRL